MNHQRLYQSVDDLFYTVFEYVCFYIVSLVVKKEYFVFSCIVFLIGWLAR